MAKVKTAAVLGDNIYLLKVFGFRLYIISIVIIMAKVKTAAVLGDNIYLLKVFGFRLYIISAKYLSVFLK